MSLKNFELKEDHKKLIKNLRFKTDGHSLLGGDEHEESTPFGGSDLYEQIGLIIYGKTIDDFDPTSEVGDEYTTEQKLYMESLFQELPTALEIVINSDHSSTGHYKRKSHGEPFDWKPNN